MFTLNNLKKCIYNSKRLVEVHIYLHTAFWEIFAKHFINIEIGEDRDWGELNYIFARTLNVPAQAAYGTCVIQIQLV